MPTDALVRPVPVTAVAAATVGVVLVDDHARYRDGLERRLRHDARFDVLGCADSVAGAVSVVEALRPAVVVADLHLADGDALDVVAALVDSDLSSRVLVVSADTGSTRARYASTILRVPVLSKELSRAALADAVAVHAERTASVR